MVLQEHRAARAFRVIPAQAVRRVFRAWQVEPVHRELPARPVLQAQQDFYRQV
jgi:hypothetical protein